MKLRQHLKLTNETVKKCQEGSAFGFIYEAGVIDWDTAVMVTITDASFAQESCSDEEGIHSYRVALVEPTIFDRDVANCHVIAVLRRSRKDMR